jgi:hypothetical protein
MPFSNVFKIHQYVVFCRTQANSLFISSAFIHLIVQRKTARLIYILIKTNYSGRKNTKKTHTHDAFMQVKDRPKQSRNINIYTMPIF